MTSSIVSSFGKASDPTERAGEKAAQRIWHLLEEGRRQTGLSRSAFFVQALRVWDALLHPLDLDEYLNTICVGIEKAVPQITQALHELQMEAIAHYLDVLGIVYMLAGVRASAGEEYTPWSLVRLLVRLQMIDFVPPAPGNPPCTFYDPCCGSGTLLLGQMEYLDFFYPEVLDRDQAHFFGQDASYEAWLMARINLRIHTLGRATRRHADVSLSPLHTHESEEISPLPTPSASHPIQSFPSQPSPSEPPDGLAPLFAHSITMPARKRKQIVQLTLPGFSSS